MVPINLFTGEDAHGGKQVDAASAEDFLQTWHQVQWQQQTQEPMLATPQPRRPIFAQLQDMMATQYAEDQRLRMVMRSEYGSRLSDTESEISVDDAHEWCDAVRINLASRFLEASSDTEAQDNLGGSDSSFTQEQRKRLAESRMQALQKKARRVARMNGQLPILLHAADVQLPHSPAVFDPSSAPDVDILKCLHPHCRDSRVVFRAQDHVYFVDHVQTNGSVTGLIHSFCSSFDADKVILGMMSGPRWPRAGYLRESPPIYSFARVAMAAPHLLEMYSSCPRDEPRICQALRALLDVDALSVHISTLCLSADEIQHKWRVHGEEAAHYGTWMHFLFEAYLNGHMVPTASPEFSLLQCFLRSESTCTAWRTEWVIFAEDENLAGSIDFCARLQDGTFLLADWKRTAELRNKFVSSSKMRHPLSHLDDCAGMQYRLQLNAYRYILEKYYGLTISRMVIVCHPDNGSMPFIDEVPRMESATAAMMQTRRKDQAGGAAGGALPVDAMATMPSLFFSWTYLKNLAAVSRSMKASVSHCEQWRGCDLFIDTPEFQDQNRLRLLYQMLQHCRTLCVNMPQMAMLREIPPQTKLVWRAAYAPVGRTSFRGVESVQPRWARLLLNFGFREMSEVSTSESKRQEVLLDPTFG